MKDYLMIILATILLAVDFSFAKVYQKKAGSSIVAGLFFNAVASVCSTIYFWCLNGFSFAYSHFSFLMGFGASLLITLYSLIRFKILKTGNLAICTLFLMAGGMTVPYIWGLIFLDETFSILRTVGLIAIFASMVLSNSGEARPDKKQLLLCSAIFVLNGFVSVLFKMHQIDTTHHAVGTTEFSLLNSVAKMIFCFPMLFIYQAKSKEKEPLPKLGSVLPVIIGSVLIAGLSSILQLNGAKNLPATVLYPIITGGSIIFTGFASMLAFREKLSSRQWAGIILCFIGTCMFL